MLVQDLMTNQVVGISPSASIIEAARLMAANRVSGLPVIEKGRLVGMISEGDFVRRSELGTEMRRPSWRNLFTSPGKLADEFAHTHGRRVAEIMSPDPITIEPAARLADAADLMVEHRIKRLPVMRDGQLVGIISRSDLMRALLGMVAENPTGNETDEQIRQALSSELSRQEWVSKDMIRFRVHNGIVELEGTIFNQQQRSALRVVAENTPGVREVKDHLVWIEPMSGMVVLSPDDTASVTPRPPASSSTATPAN